MKNHSKVNKRAFFATKKEFLIHKGEKIENHSGLKGDKKGKSLPNSYGKTCCFHK
jgi:hypothetical protein